MDGFVRIFAAGLVGAAGAVFGLLLDRFACALVEKQVAKGEELLSALLFSLGLLSLFLRLDQGWQSLATGLHLALLFLAALCDAKAYLIPNPLIACGLVLFALCGLVRVSWEGEDLHLLLFSLVNSLVIVIPLALLALMMEKLTKGPSLGGGDIKLLAVVCLFFPLQLDLLGVFLSCWLGVAIGLLTRKRQAIPLGVAVAVSFWLLMLLGS